MPSVTNKAFDALLIAMEHFANGLDKHSGNRIITAVVKPNELRMQKSELESLRESYLEKEREARIAYHAFENKFKNAQQQSSNFIRVVKGVYGPKSDALLDFGIMPEKSKAPQKRPLTIS